MLIKGDVVVMYTCGEAEYYNGQLWVCRTDEQKLHPAHTNTVVWLEGFSGAFSAKYLQKVNFDFSYKHYLDKESTYAKLIMENADLINFKKSAQKVLNEEQLLDVEDEMNNVPECV